jgi:hypothetical protein
VKGSPRVRGALDAMQDAAEGVPFASIGGLEKRSAPHAPGYVEEDEREAYLLGYAEQAERMYGPIWRTCEFGWSPAMRVEAKLPEDEPTSPETPGSKASKI